MMVSGIVLLGVGGVGVLAGLGTIALAPNHTYCDEFGCHDETSDDDIVRGGVMIGVGGAAVVAGAILTPLGARKIRIDRKAAIEIQPLLSPTGAGLRVRF